MILFDFISGGYKDKNIIHETGMKIYRDEKMDRYYNA